MHNIRSSEKKDINALCDLLRNYMKEALSCEWGGSAPIFERDGFGKEFSSVLAESPNGTIIGFGLWRPSYDIHHCISGGELMELYVKPKYRGQGIALSLIVFIAKQVQTNGGHYLRGGALSNPQVEHFYDRLAVIFPETMYNIGGRSFRCLADLSGKSLREMISDLPKKSWNYEA